MSTRTEICWSVGVLGLTSYLRRAMITPTKNAAAKACSGARRVQRLIISSGMPGSRTASIASLTRWLADRNACAVWSATDLIGSPGARGRESIAFNRSSNSPMSKSSQDCGTNRSRQQTFHGVGRRRRPHQDDRRQTPQTALDWSCGAGHGLQFAKAFELAFGRTYVDGNRPVLQRPAKAGSITKSGR
jgi:hypothetical protein